MPSGLDFKADDITMEGEETAAPAATETSTETTAETTAETKSSDTSSSDTSSNDDDKNTSGGDAAEAGADAKTDKGSTQGADSSSSTDTKADILSFESSLSDKSGGKFKTYEDVEKQIALLSKNQKTNQDELDNDLLTKFKDFRKGRNADAKSVAKLFLETQIQDFVEMDPQDVLRYKMKLDSPSRTAEDIDFLLAKKYKLDEDGDYDDTETRLAKLQLEDDAGSARKELTDMQGKLALNESSQVAGNAQNQEEIAERNEKWVKDVDTSVDDFNQLELAVDSEGGKFNFAVANNDELKDIMKHLPDFWNRYVSKDDDGNEVENIDMLREDMAFLSNKEKIIQSVHTNGVSQGRDEVLNERKNPPKKDHAEVTEVEETQSKLSEVATGLAEARAN